MTSPKTSPSRVKTIATALAGVLLAALLSAVAPSAAHAANLPPNIVDGGFIISDAEYFASGSMTQAQIQSFLNARVPTCKATTGPTCLKAFKANLPAKAADRYCKAIAAKASASASYIIAAVAKACGINPKVILVMLQKEQGLVTATAPSDWSYRAAMGQSCPDTAPCSAAAAGFVNQVHLGTRQQQVYTLNPNSFNYKPGQVNTIKWHPTASCGTSKVFIQNRATANLYIYTPYRPNVAALAAGYGTGDGCSTYGNRNFYNYYVDWFAPSASASKGAPAQVAACTSPASADVAAASGTLAAKADVTARTAPTALCTNGAATLAKGTKLTVTGAYGAWTRGTVAGKTYWVPKSSLGAVPAPAPAAVLPANVRFTALVHLRAAASLSAAVVQTFSPNTQVTVLATNGAWAEVAFGAVRGWVENRHLSTVKRATSTPAVRQTSTAVTLRAAALPTGRVLGKAAKGAKATVIAATGAWRIVTIGSTSGWVEAKYLVAPTKTATMQTTATVNLRASATTSSKSITKLAKGTKVTVSSTNGKWRKVAVGARTGWVHGDYLKTVTAAAAKAPAKATVKTTSAALNLRATASTSGKKLTVIPKGKKVTVTSSSGSWRKVTYGGRTGWVSAAYLR